MDPRAVLQPVGSRRPHVYWVRRLILLIAVTAIVVMAAHACAGGGSPTGDAMVRQRADRPAVATSSASAGTSASSTGVVTDCRARDLSVAVSADAATYPRGVTPRFTAVVRNTGRTCRFPTALSSRTWRIVSGSYQVWSTADCPRSPAGRRVTLRAGAQLSYVLRWDRFGSVAGCAAAGAKAQPGTYRLYVTIARASAPAAVFVLAG